MTTSFEMREVRKERGRCLSGASGEFGEIEVLYPVDLGPTGGTGAQVQGGAIPTALLIGWSISDNKPRLTGAQLRLGDDEVKTRRNRWAVRRKGRALRMTHHGIEYRCTAVSRKSYLFTRPGLAVTVTESGIRKKRHRLLVLIDGPAEPVDIALAVLFSGANRSHLTMGGAFRAGFSTVCNLWADTTVRT
ncbi:hypothetical protein [Streptomyces sp. NPDC056061]|uniref:hypothetical protein n=1 Tax=Streptomyces sp. NPDC056061 TaxID=3345700 RepID=UPI0035D8A2D2